MKSNTVFMYVYTNQNQVTSMRKIYKLLLLTLLLLPARPTFAQNDTTLQARINQLISQEEGIPFRADSVIKVADNLYIYFNADRAFVKGSLSETASEALTELLVHLTTETNTSNIILQVKDKISGTWKTPDYFVMTPPVEKYIPLKNKDPFPDIPGKNEYVQNRIFPGSGQPVAGGALNGKTVWLSPGHGWHNTGSGFITQRGTTNQIVEDFITAESVDYYLLHYLMNAGANVWSVRERDVNTAEIIVNNDQGAPAYTESGTWSTGSVSGYGGTYRFSTTAATATATAVFKPTVTASGLYWVSVRYISGANRASNARFTVTHSGGSTVFTVNEEVHGDTWLYLGQFYFFAGGNYNVTISNQSTETGQAVIADAVRLGGGIGQTPDCLNGGAASGKPRFEESARQYARFQGNPVCREDVTVRPTYAEWELSKGVSSEIDNAVYVALHTNAGGGTGTETYRYNGAGSSQPTITAGSTQLRDSIHKQVIADLRAGWRSTWTDRGVKTANFGELRELLTIPGTLVELAFHDLAADATDMKAPEFRRIAARAIYKGIVKFFKYQDGIPVVFLPEEPTRVSAKNIGSAQIQLSWMAPVTGGIYGHAATGYRIYTSENGRGFDNPIAVPGTTYTFTGTPGKTYFFKVAAVNAGGESFPSSVVAARTPAGTGPVKYLMVDGFDRLDASAMILKNEGGALGNVRRMFLESMNRYSYMVEHGNGLTSCDLSFDGVQDEVVSAGGVNLSDYFAIDWFSGEESTIEKTLDATEKQKIKDYLDGGGRLLISGAEIGWDIGRSASPNADLAFYNNYLKAVYVSDDAGTYNIAGTSNLFTGENGTFGNGFNGYYDVDYADVIGTAGGSELVLNYTGGSGVGAGTGFKGTFSVLYFGFPIEAIINDNDRNNLICQSAAYLEAPASTIAASGFLLTGKQEGLVNKLEWKSRPGVDAAYFIVERSNDGVHFEPVGAPVTSSGHTTPDIFRFNDMEVLPTTHYRVQAVDKDRRLSYSNRVIITKNNVPLFHVLENPVRSAIRVRATGASSFTVKLTNVQGQTVYQSGHNIISSGDIVIPAGKLAKGPYWLTAYTDAGRVQTFKIVVQ
jgi:N-acetylmuramoyl-L-alanine amidase